MASGNSSGVIDFSDGTTAKVVQANAVHIPGSAPCGGAPEGSEASTGFNPGIGVGVAGLAVVGLGAVAIASNRHNSRVSP